MQIAQDADSPKPEVRIRWLCQACGKWIERTQPALVHAGRRILVPVDASDLEQYGLDVYRFGREHHECYMDTGGKIRALAECDQEFPGLDPEKRQD